MNKKYYRHFLISKLSIKLQRHLRIKDYREYFFYFKNESYYNKNPSFGIGSYALYLGTNIERYALEKPLVQRIQSKHLIP